ncbi:hypothetical protein KIKIMORA_01410 [Brevundimonas phage vB_BpoS-Kikimora]|uniref:Uncharacterized protein n=1 Tax=Brevundimonas phage vB_BpoS-Kikimora TaxID=2948601 RepID=A0A9E7MSJ9_9CAUD|nr:hypothetical protein KIKIMORA_01410 [Brevundimonas phage vB_BpoS-Kikimora]
MPDSAYKAFLQEHKERLETKVKSWGQAYQDDPFSAIESLGAVTGMVEAVCEHQVLKIFSRSAGTTGEAIKALDAYIPLLLGSLRGDLTATEIYESQSRWVEVWRRRLEKLQRENPNVV